MVAKQNYENSVDLFKKVANRDRLSNQSDVQIPPLEEFQDCPTPSNETVMMMAELKPSLQENADTKSSHKEDDSEFDREEETHENKESCKDQEKQQREDVSLETITEKEGLEGLLNTEEREGMSSRERPSLNRFSDLLDSIEEENIREDPQGSKDKTDKKERRERREDRESRESRESRKSRESGESGERRESGGDEKELDEEREKELVLLDLENLRIRNGVKLSRDFTMQDSLADMQFEIKRHLIENEEETSVRFMKDSLKLACTGLEMLNNRAGPFLELNGWSQEVCNDMDKYNNAFGKLYRKYWRRSNMSPELEIAMGLAGSIGMYHFKAKFMTSVTATSPSPEARSRPQGNPPSTQNMPQNTQNAQNSRESLPPRRPPIKFPGRDKKNEKEEGSLL